MPDILIQCPECSREYKVSEYATMDGMKCLTCGAGLNRPESLLPLGGGLQLKRSVSVAAPPPLPLGDDEVEEDVTGPVVPNAPALEIHKDVDVKAPSRALPWLIGLVLIGSLIGFQYFADRLDAYLVYYTWTRNVFAVGAYLVVVLLAFQDHLGQGALSLVCPPYTIFYTSSSVESGILRGIFFGMVVVIMTETYFLPDHSILVALGQEMSRFIDNVDGLLLEASDSPI